MTPKERVWLASMPRTFFNATEAARLAGYKWPDRMGAQLKAKFKDEIEALVEKQIMGANEAAQRMAAAARFDISEYIENNEHLVWIDTEKLKADGYGWIIKGLKYDSKGNPVFELVDKQRALEKIFDNASPSLGDKEKPFHIKYITENRDDS